MSDSDVYFNLLILLGSGITFLVFTIAAIALSEWWQARRNGIAGMKRHETLKFSVGRLKKHDDK